MENKKIHGGDIYHFNSERQSMILDYSSNINPMGVSSQLKNNIMENFNLLERYPDVNYTELRENIGKFNGVKKENIIVGNGAVEVLFLYMKALSPKSAMIISPTFAEYERALKNIDCKINYHELRESQNFRLYIDRVMDEITDEEVLVLCNPNNPTGKFIPLLQIEELNRRLISKGIKLFIDECFIEFIDGWEKMSSLILKNENIFILRAFTKFFGIPGLRLGYGVTTDSELLKKIDSFREPWSINSFAELAGKTLPWDTDYIRKTYLWINLEKKWFYDELSKNSHLKVYKTETNFILIKLMGMTSEDFRKKMLEGNILVRDASNFKFLDNSFVRLAIKNRENNIRVIRKIQEATWKQY
ncbi:MAG: pyridoxal phosphate-dependent aminotransferase [Fusobacteriaceae bacterium]